MEQSTLAIGEMLKYFWKESMAVHFAFIHARETALPTELTLRIPEPGCSKLTTSLVNETLKFQLFISQICQYFLLKKCEKLLQCKSFSHFF